MQSSNHPRANDHLISRYRSLAQDHDIKGIPVTSRAPGRQSHHTVAAIRSWDKPVKSGRLRRSSLRAVDPEVARQFIDLIFHQIEWCYFHKNVENIRGRWADIEAMPWMGSEHIRDGPGIAFFHRSPVVNFHDRPNGCTDHTPWNRTRSREGEDGPDAVAVRAFPERLVTADRVSASMQGWRSTRPSSTSSVSSALRSPIPGSSGGRSAPGSGRAGRPVSTTRATGTGRGGGR